VKKFNIEVYTKNPKKIEGFLYQLGKITIGNFTEKFLMSLDTWTVEEYKQQWKEGIERIRTHHTSCLVATIQNLEIGYPLIILWTLYKENNTVFVRNQILNIEIAKELNLPINISDFNIKTCYQFINPRITDENGLSIDEDGNEISEWSVPLSEI